MTVAIATAARRGALVFAGVAEAATGFALVVAPSLVVRMLLGGDLAGVAGPVSRVAGMALVGLGVACWPGPPRIGMLAYGASVTVYLAYLGLAGAASGVLLWPAVVLHMLLSLSLALPGEPPSG